MYNRVARKEVSCTAIAILAAFSLSIGTATIVNAKPSTARHVHAKNASQTDGKLIAGFPFRKSKSDTKANSATDTNTNSVKDAPENSSPRLDLDASAKSNSEDKQVAPEKSEDKSKDEVKDEVKVKARGKDKTKDKGKGDSTEKSNDKSETADKKNSKAAEKAAAKAKDDKEESEKESAKLAKKSEKQKSKEEKKRKDDADDAAQSAKDAANTAQLEKAAADKVAADKKARENKNASQKPATEYGDERSRERSQYVADSALISLLHDLARALKDPAEQAKLGDENQKFVVQMASEVLSRALETRSDSNRIVDKKVISGTSMSAEAWSSGDVKVSGDCRGSLAAVWAKKENGLLNVTIAGACKDKVAPSGKAVGEYVVILSARSTVQKGFDIQSQSDVTFWLAKLTSVNVDASCFNTESANQDKTSDIADSDTKELKKNSTVVLQAIMTERERLFSTQNNEPQTAKASEAAVKPSDAVVKANEAAVKAHEAAVKAHQQSEKDRVASERKAKESKEEQEEIAAKAAEAEQKNQKKQAKIAAAEKQRQLDEELKQAEAESQRKLEEDDRRAAAEKKQKREEEIRLAEVEKLQKAEKKQKREDENDDRDMPRKNSHFTRDDAILAEATRQAELEQIQGSSGRISRDDAILAEATRQAELEQAQGVGPAITRDDAVQTEATRQAETERREAADMRIPFSSYNSTSNNSATTLVDIGDQQTALRPTLSNQPSSSAPLISSANSGPADTTTSDANGQGLAISSAAMQYPTPPAAHDSADPNHGAKIILPARAIAGQYITATVVDANLDAESGIELGFNGVSLSTDSRGQVTFMVPEDAVPGRSLSVAMTGNSSLKPVAIEVLQPLAVPSQLDAPTVEHTSPTVSKNGTVIIDGHNFDGVADHNKVQIDDSIDCKVTAASPVQLRITAPSSLAPGAHFVTVYAGTNKSNPGKFTLTVAAVQPAHKEAAKVHKILRHH